MLVVAIAGGHTGRLGLGAGGWGLGVLVVPCQQARHVLWPGMLAPHLRRSTWSCRAAAFDLSALLDTPNYRADWEPGDPGYYNPATKNAHE